MVLDFYERFSKALADACVPGIVFSNRIIGSTLGAHQQRFLDDNRDLAKRFLRTSSTLLKGITSALLEAKQTTDDNEQMAVFIVHSKKSNTGVLDSQSIRIHTSAFIVKDGAVGRQCKYLKL